jgi:hypothetical protein
MLKNFKEELFVHFGRTLLSRRRVVVSFER